MIRPAIQPSFAARSHPSTALDAAKLGSEVNRYADKAIFYSEGDSAAHYVAVPFNKPMTGPNIAQAMQGELATYFKDNDPPYDPSQYTTEMSSAHATQREMDSLATYNPDDPDMYKEPAEAFGKINGLLRQSLTDLRLVRYGPKAEDGSMAIDQGAYVYLLVGKTRDGKLAGITYESVET